MKRGPRRQLSLVVSAFLLILVLAVSGCICINRNVPTPTPDPTATLITTATPSPAPSADIALVGLWEGHYKYVDYSMEFYENGKLLYNEGGNMATGSWEKTGEKQYLVGILIYDSVITLNDNMTFVWGDKAITFTKRA